MSVEASHERDLDNWDPMVELEAPYNVTYFSLILPQLQLIKVVKDDQEPAVIEKSLEHKLHSLNTERLTKQDEWLETQELMPAFASEREILDKELIPEEKRVRRLHRVMVKLALFAAGDHSNRYSNIEPATEDILLLLNSLNRPTHLFKQLSDNKNNFLAKYISAMQGSGRFDESQQAKKRQELYTALCRACIEPTTMIKTIAEKADPAILQPVPPPKIPIKRKPKIETNASRIPKENKSSLLSMYHEWDETEINFQNQPLLNIFCNEFKWRKNDSPKTVQEAIARLNIEHSNLVNASIDTKERMSSYGIAAYLKMLADDAVQQGSKLNLSQTLDRITENGDGLIANIIDFANGISALARRNMKESSKINISVTASSAWRKYSPLDKLPKNLYHAFAILRSSLTEDTAEPIIESQMTKQLLVL